jgi:hypothetical protein
VDDYDRPSETFGPQHVAWVSTARRPGGMGFLAAKKCSPGGRMKPAPKKAKKKPFRSPKKWKD